MYPGFGPQKIEMNKRTGSSVPSGEYEAMKNSMMKQVGAGMELEASRDPKYGGMDSIPDETGGIANAPISKPTAQTAQLGFFSSTQSPQQQPEMMGREAEEGIKQRVLGEPGGLNDRQSLYRRGN